MKNEFRLDEETENFRRFDFGCQIDDWKKEQDRLSSKGGNKLYRAINEYQLRESVKKKWLVLEQDCDAHNINEGFRLAKETTSEREKRDYIKFYQKVLKESSNSTYMAKPLKWKKEWDMPSKPLIS